MTKKEDHGARTHHGHAQHGSAKPCCSGHKAPVAGAVHGVKDPVCGMSVDPQAAKHKASHEARTFYFCSAGCKTKFETDPERYLAPEKAAAPVDPAAIYTCPMHPEIRQPGPGSCPICGMALEPEIATADSGPNPELADMTRRFWIGLVLTLPVLVLEMGRHLFPALMHAVPQSLSNWLQLAFATPVVLWAGLPFFERGWRSLVTQKLNMFTLIALGTGVAWVYSVIATIFPTIFPAALQGHDGSMPVYFEAAAVITVLVLLGQVLELKARDRTSGAIKA
ncbi:MAG: YHS domain-containing protein, partial [Parvibaculaceae bacterium]